MHQAAEQACAEFDSQPETAANIGVTAAILDAFRQQVSEFGELIDTTDAHYKDRKADRGELLALFPANNAILREQIEPVIRFESVSNQGLYREYLIARSAGATRKPVGNEDKLTDISGVVTDITTNEAVANATVDIAAFELITVTDADGYYLFEGLPAGQYTLNCHAAGYRTPEKATVTTADGESMLVDFSLQPETLEATA